MMKFSNIRIPIFHPSCLPPPGREDLEAFLYTALQRTALYNVTQKGRGKVAKREAFSSKRSERNSKRVRMWKRKYSKARAHRRGERAADTKGDGIPAKL